MTNPLGTRSQSREMAVGETRTIHDPKSDRTWSLRRTNRPYAYDLVDAYNAELPQDSPFAWFIDATGNPRIGDNPAWSQGHAKQLARRLETERARHLRHTLSNAA